MTLKLLVLFFTPLLAGLVVYLVPSPKGTNFKLVLVFAGAYLFAITVTHILPDLYREHGDMALIGLFVLAGFFLQQLLEYFTSGIEHGHIHTHDHNHEHHHHHTHHQASALVLLVALCVHAFLEGSMLAQPEVMGIGYSVNAVLLGIALHRAPAAFALMTVLASQLHSKAKAIPHLIIFSLAAPIGLLVSSYFAESKVITETGMIYLYALVSGNFLHISTTIVFESSPEHRFNAKKLAVAIAGAMLAVAVEYAI
ncbi:MAG TPA: ZIP family metal transporter [Cyclobacteriaceae bacterium]|nr:ZIP family metal transporter [Cyclobacteriaceae bacterium]